MSDRDRRLRAVDDEEREEPRQTYHEERHIIDHTGPLVRLVGVAGAVAGVVLIGFWLEEVGLGDEFGTFAVATIAFSIGYWADKRPDRMRRRAGTFWRFADAARESREDIRRSTYRRPFRYAVAVSSIWALALVLAKSAVVALIALLYDWRLAVGFGAIIGAGVVAPQFFSDIWRRISRGPDDYADYYEAAEEHEEEYDDEDYEDEYDDDQEGDQDER